MRIRSGDKVLVIAGKEKGKEGTVDRQLTKENRIVVEGVNFITRHVKPRPGVRQSGRIQQEAPIHISNVALICIECGRTRIQIREKAEGKKVRICVKCEAVIS